MLPNFLITGTQKGATSWLAVCLGEHPQIFIPEEKEIFFFDKYFSRGLEWYEAQFTSWSGETAVGEATPNYIFEPVVPARIFKTLGNIKLITSLRHPVDRAYSAFWHYVRRGFIPKDADFSATFVQDGEFALQSRGNYFQQIKRYNTYFPPENHLIIFQEQIKENPSKIIQQCYQHLGVDIAYQPTKLDERVNSGARVLLFHSYIYKARKLVNKLPENVRSIMVSRANQLQKHMPEAQKQPKLDPDLRSELFEKYYSADVKKLSQLMEIDVSCWK